MAIPQKRTASGRVNFAKIHDVAETPDLLGIQLQSFQDFFQLDAAGSGNLRGRARAHGQVAQLVRASD